MGGTITIVGTGWTRGELTLQIADILSGGARIILHTDHCGCAEWLAEKGIAFASLDALYERCEDFDEHARAAAGAVREAAEGGDVVYAVPDVRDRSAQLLMSVGVCSTVFAGPPAEGALLALCDGETRFIEASDWNDIHLTARENCLIRELESRELACEIKLRLMEVYPEAEDIWVLNGGEAPAALPLFELDRLERYDHRTCALIPAQRDITKLERYDAGHLNEIMRFLCGPKGCPWDRAQTHETLRTCMLEEAYEVIDAIDEGDPDHLCDELGDVLMQVAIHAEIARLHGEFDMTDVATAICEKMIRRHTHIFGSDKAQSADEVLELWSKNKMAERHQTTRTQSLREVTRTLPALLRAAKVMKRSAEAGLGDAKAGDVLDRCARRLAVAAEPGEAELGAALLDLANVARLRGIDPEIALNGAVNRFIDRFEAAEREITAQGGEIGSLNAESLRKYWDSVKL